MGKLITIWSPMHRQSNTASMIALAYGLENVILTHTQTKMSQLEYMLGLKKPAQTKVLDNTGMNGLIFATAAGRASDSDIRKATISIPHTGIELLPALGTGQVEDREDYVRYLLADRLRNIYDYVFVDLPAGDRGSDFELTKKLWAAADVNCVVLADAILWDDYSEKYKGLLENPVYILGNYHPESKYNLTSFRINYSKRVATVPYCTGYYDAISACSVPSFLLKNKNAAEGVKKNAVNGSIKARKLSKNDDVAYFMAATSEVKKWYG